MKKERRFKSKELRKRRGEKEGAFFYIGVREG